MTGKDEVVPLSPVGAPASLRLQDLLDGTERLSPDAPLVAVDLDGVTWPQDPPRVAELADRLRAAIPAVGRRPVLVGVTRGQLPPACGPVVEQLTLTLGHGPAPWCVGSADDLAAIEATVAETPQAAQVLADVLTAAEGATTADGLHVESLAYSLLLAGPEFARWRASRPRRAVAPSAAPVVLRRDGSRLSIALNRPERHNAWGHALRDAFLEALAIAEWDHDVTAITVRGNGPSFCSGGDLDEFGTAPDPVTAHRVRLERSAGRAVDGVARRLGPALTFELHGACIGAGIEIPAFARSVRARSDSRFRLPELGLGLIPGAGGTVSIPRRIGRWRTAWWALTLRELDAATACDWGLVDEVC